MRVVIACLTAALLTVGFLGCSQEESGIGELRPTVAATATEEEEPEVPTGSETVPEIATPAPAATRTLAPTQAPVTNRMSCAAISGTAYLSEDERQWYQANCVVEEPPPIQQPEPDCHPSYVGACLLPNASDYDCAGGSGNGPYYTGPVQVVGPDVFDLDRDNDGLGCE